VSLNAAPLDADVVSNGEFTRRRGVSPDRVSQWIDAGPIADLVIVGEGRTAQIRERQSRLAKPREESLFSYKERESMISGRTDYEM